MSQLFKKLVATTLMGSLQAAGLCGIVHLTDREYWSMDKLGYLSVFWMGGVMPLKMVQYGVNKTILRKLDLPNYNFFYMTHPRALFVDLSLNHLFFPFIQVTMLFNYFQHVYSHIFLPKPATVERFHTLRADKTPQDILRAEKDIAQQGLQDILRFRLHLSAVSVLWDLVFPRFNMSRQTASKIVTDLTKTGKKIQFIKTQYFVFIWNTYTIHKYFQFHH